MFDGTGKPVAKETIVTPPDSDCGGEPRLGDVWYDSARKRALARGDECAGTPGSDRMWTLP